MTTKKKPTKRRAKAKAPRSVKPVNFSADPDLLAAVDEESGRTGINRTFVLRKALEMFSNGEHFWLDTQRGPRE